MMVDYVPVIGLEVHAQLATVSKVYAPDATSFGQQPNTNISIVTLAHPGALPKLNKKAIEFAMRMGLACDSEISRYNIFDRKNYFYPDLPKGYQLTQDRTPICKGGFVTIRLKDGSEKNIPLNRIHLEEDAGKSIHDSGTGTLVDLNRAGVALIEIVTEPAIANAEDAAAFLTEVRKLVRYLGICDGNMEEGSLRCDANVSVRPSTQSVLGKKVEIKNMNSIRHVQAAIELEIQRQIALLQNGMPVISETRTYDPEKAATFSMRTKEELNDYRYFPDPDLSPVIVSDEWLNQIKTSMPALPRQLFEKFIKEYGLPAYDAQVLTDTRETAVYFEEVCAHTKNFKAASNWVMGPVKSYLNERGIEADQFPVSAGRLADLIQLIDSGKVSYTIALQRIFPELTIHLQESPLQCAERLNVLQESDVDALLPIINDILKEFPLKVEEYKKGKKGIMSMFMGELMKRSKGKADPKVASELIGKQLSEIK